MSLHAQQPSLPASTQAVLDVLEQAGYSAWVVGGFVRDSLLGRPVHDVDIATNAHWQQVQTVAEAHQMHTFETGVAHGTLSVRAFGETVEVTTYRHDGAYSDGRHPDNVDFVDTIEEDLARRDFTINALAWHPTRGLCDPFGGQADLEAGIIRAVGDARTRFAEDALRIVRAVRFASELGFTIDSDTLAGIDAEIGRLDVVARERISTEMDRLLCGTYARQALLAYPTVVDAIVPELAPLRGLDQKSPYHIYDAMEHTAYVVQYCPATRRDRWAALLHDTGKPETFFVDEKGQGHFYGHPKYSEKIARMVLGRLKYSPRFIHDVALLVRYHDAVVHPTPKAVKKMLRKLDERVDLFRAFCHLQRADSLAHAPKHQRFAQTALELEQILDTILEEGEPFSLQDLALSGHDVREAGIPEGPDIGALLRQALDAVIEEQVPNEKEALLAYLGLN